MSNQQVVTGHHITGTDQTTDAVNSPACRQGSYSVKKDQVKADGGLCI